MSNFQYSEFLLKVFGKIFFIFFLSLFQMSFLSVMPWPLNYLNLILSIIFFVAIILDYWQGLWLALFFGLILDFFSFFHFGTITIVILITLIIIEFLFKNFFTNKSLYSLIVLGFLGNIIYATGLLVFNFLYFIFNVSNGLNKFLTSTNIYGLFWQMIFNVCILFILFLVYNFLSKKLKSVFY